ncbi:hypothetical protein [Lacticaseibacillus sp. GG6-2]
MNEPHQQKLKLVSIVTALIGVVFCTVGGATIVSAFKHGTNLIFPVAALVIGFALIELATKRKPAES